MQWGTDLGNSLPKDAVGYEHLHVLKTRLDKLIIWINKYREILFKKHVGLCSRPVSVENGEGIYKPHSAHMALIPGEDDKGWELRGCQATCHWELPEGFLGHLAIQTLGLTYRSFYLLMAKQPYGSQSSP